MSHFDGFGLSHGILRAVADQGYTQPTPIQAQAIPVVLDGKDLMAGAQTGTGKTAGFTLPLLQRLSAQEPANHRGRRAVRALILAPTRELAAQVHESVRTYSRYLRLRSTVVFGGVSINPQFRALRAGVDILVATPGRLLDHVGQRTLDLSQVEILVLDEADRMLDMGFLPDIKRIIELMPEKRQNLMFSATFSREIKALASKILVDPVSITVAAENTAAERVDQTVHPVDRNRKRELLTHLLRKGDWANVLVFTRTKHCANRLVKQLDQDGFSASAIHGDKTQNARTQALAKFKKGNIRILVATDIAARGLDIDRLPFVVNFELPDSAENYVHRIGRTGRAGREGSAVSLVSREEKRMLRDIERLLKTEIKCEFVEGFEPESRMASQSYAKGSVRNRKPSYSDGPRYRDDRSSSYKRDDQSSSYKRDGQSNAYNRDDQPSSYKRDDRSSSFKRDDRSSSFKRDDRSSSFKRDDRPASFKRDDRPASFKSGEVTAESRGENKPVKRSKPKAKQFSWDPKSGDKPTVDTGNRKPKRFTQGKRRSFT